MTYSDRIKSFDRIRELMRSFMIEGYKRREAFAMSARSYDDARRRIENWLGANRVTFNADELGKRYYIKLDGRDRSVNPIYAAFATRYFAPHDIFLHFTLLDILPEYDETPMPFAQIEPRIHECWNHYANDNPPDTKTLRTKLNEYADLGVITSVKTGHVRAFRKARPFDVTPWRDAIAFFSETAPLGVLGAYLLAQTPNDHTPFQFAHHYAHHVLDSEVFARLLEAIQGRECVEITATQPDGTSITKTVLPLCLRKIVCSGRQWILACSPRHYWTFRLACITSIKPKGKPDWDTNDLRNWPNGHIWGISCKSKETRETIDMVIRAEPGEKHVLERLQREKRCGSVEIIDDCTRRFHAELTDANEAIPWLRSFVGYIVSMHCSNADVEARFWQSIRDMISMY